MVLKPIATMILLLALTGVLILAVPTVTALDLGKKTVARIKQNLFWEYVYNAGLIPIAAGVLVPIFDAGIFGWLSMLAGLAMAMSSATVVGNSILLGRYKPKFASKNVKGMEGSYYNDHFKHVYTPSPSQI